MRAMGESGLDLWESRHQALVMLDIMLPRRSGIEVLDRIHAVDRDQPVIVLTAYGTAERYNDRVARGATLFLEEPVEGVKLRVACESVLRRRDDEEISAWLARTQGRIEDFGNRVTAADEYLSSGRVQSSYGAQSRYLGLPQCIAGSPRAGKPGREALIEWSRVPLVCARTSGSVLRSSFISCTARESLSKRRPDRCPVPRCRRDLPGSLQSVVARD